MTCPVRVAGLGKVVGLDAAEVRARVCWGFDADAVLRIALAAEPAIVNVLNRNPEDGE